MKPFNLEKALAGDPVITRKGYKVTGLKHYPEAYQDDFCITALVHHNNVVVVETFKINGSFNYLTSENAYDLFMDEPEIWVNIFYSKTENSCWAGSFYQSESEARFNGLNMRHYQQTIKIQP